MMRRQIKLMGWLFVSALAACTSETPNPADGGNAADETQKLVINLSDGGDRLTTRAGRPLHSSEPGQWVQHVTLYVTNEQGIVLQKEIDEHVWANAVDYSNGKQLEVTFRATEGEQLPAGDYTVYAVAFSKKTDYRIIPEPNSNPEINAIEDGQINPLLVQPFDFTNNFSAVLNSGVADAEEIFAGVAKVTATTVVENNCLVPTQEGETAVYEKKEVPFITLNRQVAGTIGYFTNIPATVNGIAPTKIRLVAANRSDKVWFTSMIGGETENNNVSWVINGSQSATLPKNAYYYGSDKTTYDAYEIYSIDLSKWFKFGGTSGRATFTACDLNNDGYVGQEDADKYIEDTSKKLSDFWENPNSTTEHPQQLMPGSVFAGRFLIPFSLVSGKETFELQLLGNETGKPEQILKSWRVKVSADGKHDVTDVEVPTGVIVPAADQDYVYNIYRNHMYSIGKKTADGAIEGDDPADLNTAQDLIITVNSQWQIVHGMELEPAQ